MSRTQAHDDRIYAGLVSSDVEPLIETIRSSVIGRDEMVDVG